MIRAILLAAGQSKRLKGENKLIRKFKNKPLIKYAINSLIKSEISKIARALPSAALNNPFAAATSDCAILRSLSPAFQSSRYSY